MVAEFDLPVQLLMTCVVAAIVVISIAWGCSSLSRRLPSASLAWLSLLLAFVAPILFAFTRWCELLFQGETSVMAWAAVAVYCALTLPVISNSFVGITKHRRYSFEHPSTFEIAVTDQPTEQHPEPDPSLDGVRT